MTAEGTASVNAEKILPPATLVAPPVLPRPRKETFRQVRRGSLSALRQAHRLTASQERLLVELVLEADHRTAQVRGFTLAAWSEYLCEGRNTTARALRGLEAAGLVSVEGLKPGREGVVTVLCWQGVVRARPSDPAQVEAAPERREPAQVTAPERREDRAEMTRGPRRFDAKDQGFQALEQEELKNPARGVAEPHRGSAVPLRARAESDDVVTALAFAFPSEDLCDLLRLVDTLRAEGVTDTTLAAATTAALKAGARSLRKWWVPRVRDLHTKGATKDHTTTRPQTPGPDPAALYDRTKGDAWCPDCFVNRGETLRPGHCHCDTTPAPAFGIVTHTTDHTGPQEPAGGWGIVTHRRDLVGAA